MRIALVLVPFLVISLALAYTLPGTNFKGDNDMRGHKIINASAPANASDVALQSTVTIANSSMKSYVDANDTLLHAFAVSSNSSMKDYVDSVVTGGGLATTGGRMTGNISMGGKYIYWLASPFNSTSAATKGYVDANDTLLDAAITSANSSMKAYVDANDTLLDAAIVAANNSIKTYVDSNDTLLDAAIVFANSSMKSYVDTVVSSPYYVTVGRSGCTYTTDGTADDVQIQQAIDSFSGRAGVVQLVGTTYNLASQITVREGVEVKGVNTAYRGGVSDMPLVAASLLNITNTTTTAIKMYPGSTWRDTAFLYPNQVKDGTPTTYPSTFTLSANGSRHADDITIAGNVGINPYYFCDATVAHERLRFVDNCGQPISIGIKINASTDIDYIERNHWNPRYALWGGYAAGDNLLYWTRENGKAFWTLTADWNKYIDNFAFGYKYGMYFDGTDAPYVIGNGFDRTQCGFYLNNVIMGRFENNYINSYGNSSILPNSGYAVVITGASGRGNTFVNNHVVGSAGAFSIDSLRTICIGNNLPEFDMSDSSGNNGFWVQGSADGSIIANNVANGGSNTHSIGFAIDNGATCVVVSGNYALGCADYGYIVVSGASGFNLVNNIYSSCGTGVSDGSGGVTKTVSGNIQGA